MSINHHLKEIIGKTVTGVVAKRGSRECVFILFSDSTYMEFYGSDFSNIKGLRQGVMQDVIDYCSDMKIVFKYENNVSDNIGNNALLTTDSDIICKFNHIKNANKYLVYGKYPDVDALSAEFDLAMEQWSAMPKGDVAGWQFADEKRRNGLLPHQVDLLKASLLLRDQKKYLFVKKLIGTIETNAYYTQSLSGTPREDLGYIHSATKLTLGSLRGLIKNMQKDFKNEILKMLKECDQEVFNELILEVNDFEDYPPQGEVKKNVELVDDINIVQSCQEQTITTISTQEISKLDNDKRRSIYVLNKNQIISIIILIFIGGITYAMSSTEINYITKYLSMRFVGISIFVLLFLVFFFVHASLKMFGLLIMLILTFFIMSRFHIGEPSVLLCFFLFWFISSLREP